LLNKKSQEFENTIAWNAYKFENQILNNSIIEEEKEGEHV
jgi:hypothetical protein